MKAPRKDAWTDEELQLLYDHIHVENAVIVLMEALPKRSKAAIEQRLSRIRIEAGIRIGGDGPRSISDRRAFNEAAKHSSEALAQAIEDELQRLERGRNPRE